MTPATGAVSDPRAIVVGRAALFAGLLGNAAGHAYLFAVLPSLGRQFGFADLQTGVLLSLGALALLVAAPVWGGVAERWGRRPVLLVGLVAAALAMATFGAVVQGRMADAVAASVVFVALLVARILQSLLAGGLLPAAQAYVADVTTAGRRAGGMGMMGAAFGLGSVVGASAAWLFAGFSLPLGFAAVAAVLAAAALLVARYLAEPQRPGTAGASFRSRLDVARIWPFLLVTAFGVTTYSLMQTVTGLRLQDALGLAPQVAAGRAGAALTAAALATVAGQILLIGVLGWPPRRLLRVGAAAALAAMVALVFVESYAGIVVAMAAFGLSLGLLLPGNLAALSLGTGAGAQGKVAGVNAIGQGLGMVAGPIVGVALYRLSPSAPYIAAAVLLAVILLLAAAVARFDDD